MILICFQVLILWIILSSWDGPVKNISDSIFSKPVDNKTYLTVGLILLIIRYIIW